jgi:hypothetical protein
MAGYNYYLLAEAMSEDPESNSASKPDDKAIAEVLGCTVKQLNREGSHDARDDEMDSGMNPQRKANKSK